MYSTHCSRVVHFTANETSPGTMENDSKLGCIERRQHRSEEARWIEQPRRIEQRTGSRQGYRAATIDRRRLRIRRVQQVCPEQVQRRRGRAMTGLLRPDRGSRRPGR